MPEKYPSTIYNTWYRHRFAAV